MVQVSGRFFFRRSHDLDGGNLDGGEASLLPVGFAARNR